MLALVEAHLDAVIGYDSMPIPSVADHLHLVLRTKFMVASLYASLALMCVGCSTEVTMDPANPVVHEAYSPDEPSAVEYFLPQPRIPADVASKLPRWIRELTRVDEFGIRELLVKRWQNVAQPELLLLRDQLLSYKPVSVVIRDEQAWLSLDSGLDNSTVGSTAYIPAACDPHDLDRRLAEFDIQQEDLFHSFMHHFAGLAEDFLSSGNFIDLTEEWSTLHEDWQEEIIENFSEWKGSLLFYHARNGDQLLLHPNGNVGWLKFAEGRVTSDFDSFAAFVEFYVAFRSKTPWPLDSYGP